jgi:hypothetical protein
MPASFAPLRILLGAFCVFFAYYLGRSLAARIEGRAPNSRVMRWGLRVAVTAIGVVWGGFDALAMTLVGVAALSAALGFFAQQRPREPGENLTKVMFPKQ